MNDFKEKEAFYSEKGKQFHFFCYPFQIRTDLVQESSTTMQQFDVLLNFLEYVYKSLFDNYNSFALLQKMLDFVVIFLMVILS